MHKKLKKSNSLVGLILFAALLISIQSCKTEYEKTVEAELDSGVVHDSLIHGLKIGQTKKEFYNRCWALNKSHAITAGSGNRYALFVIPSDTTDQHPDKINVEFYGLFDEEDVMYGMEMKMEYYSWAPWLDQFQSNKLMDRTRKRMMKDYPGNDFIEIKVGEINALVKVDGNRQIRMYPLSDKQIMVKIEDLRSK